MGRNASGTYSLPAGNPVVTNTTISSTVFNNTMTDIASAMTDSLSRSGDGAMTAQLGLVDGSAGTPALATSSDPDTGWYRSASGVWVFSSNGTDSVRVGESDNLEAWNGSSWDAVLIGSINNDDWDGTDLSVANGGTGASSASDARTNLGLVIGTDVQEWDAALTTIAGFSATDGNFIVGNGSAWVTESGATARTSLGLGSLATQDDINDDDWSGTDLAVANGGTGASDASGARSNLGIGSMATRDVTIQSGGSPSGGSDGDVFLIY